MDVRGYISVVHQKVYHIFFGPFWARMSLLTMQKSFNLLIPCILLLQTGVTLSSKGKIISQMEALGVVPDVIDVAPAAKIKVNSFYYVSKHFCYT